MSAPAPAPAFREARANPVLVGLSAAVTMAALIGVSGNQWVFDRVNEDRDREFKLGDFLLDSLTSFSWRFSPPDYDYGRRWIASVVFVVAVVLLTAVITAVASGRRTGAVRVLAVTWTSVVVASLLATFLAAAVVDLSAVPGGSDVESPLAGTFPAFNAGGSFILFASLVYGFLAGAVASLVALLTGRPATRRTDPS